MLLTKQQLIEFLEINIPNHARVEVSGELAEPGKITTCPDTESQKQSCPLIWKTGLSYE